MTQRHPKPECGTACEEFVALTRTNERLHAEVARLTERYDSLVKSIRAIGARIPCNTGGTFENDPPDAIVDAAWREARDAKQEVARLTACADANACAADNATAHRKKLETEVARLTAHNSALLDTFGVLRDFIEGHRHDTGNITAIINGAVCAKKT